MAITKKSVEIAGRTLTLEYGRYAEQSSAAVVASYGETMVLATVTASAKESNLDYFPLSVEYQERLYAGGRIKGSRWVKREGRPTDDAILTGRLIDRSIRPLFPKAYHHDVQVIITTLSVDGENDPDVLGLVAASAAIAISPIPWKGPVGGVRIGYFESEEKKEYLVNPTAAEQELSEFDFVVSGTKEKTLMLEGGFCETKDDVVYGAVLKAKEENKKIIACIEELVKEVGKKKNEAPIETALKELEEKIHADFEKEMTEAFAKKAEKEGADSELPLLAQTIAEKYEQVYSVADIMKVLDIIFKKNLRINVLTKAKRVDGRKIDEVRPLSMDVSLLPRTHGSAMFKRGQTQVLTVATLATPNFEQLIESPMGEENKRYIHHYSMPPYSVGETGRVGTPSRREIGHGALAERALMSVIPSEEDFPYTIRLVSEVMSSNGSTSMASTCGSTLALVDAGVPIKELVAGISVGLMTDPASDKYVLLTDIVGVEDFAGDMDFKVAGTKNGITAIQLDVKLDGITDEMVKGALERAVTARLYILDEMKKVVGDTRKKLSAFAPKIQKVKVPVEKIGEVIGPGGRVIRSIIASTGAEVDVKDDGSIFISSMNEDNVTAAVNYINGLTHEVVAGEEFDGEVKRMLSFGAFVEILPGKEGMVHVSQMKAGAFVNDPSEVVSLGQKVHVRVVEVDDQGRVNLSMLTGEEAKNVPPREHRPSQGRTFDRRRRF